MSTDKKRNPNFTENEVQVLIEEVEKNKSILFSKLTNVATNSSKKKIWDSICNKINAGNTSHRRSVDEIRKKWSTYTSNTKKRAAFIRRESKKTGGGPPPDVLTPLQEKVVEILGNTPVEGISGGIDTCTPSTSSQSACAIDQGGDSDSPVDDIDQPSTLVLQGHESSSSRSSFSKSSNLTESQIPSDEKTIMEIEQDRLAIEKERLATDKQRLETETERLRVERERLAVETQRLELEQKSLKIREQKFQLYMTKLNLELSRLGVYSNGPAPTNSLNN